MKSLRLFGHDVVRVMNSAYDNAVSYPLQLTSDFEPAAKAFVKMMSARAIAKGYGPLDEDVAEQKAITLANAAYKLWEKWEEEW